MDSANGAGAQFSWTPEGQVDRRAVGLAQVVRYDPMTGLPNRARLKEFLQHAIDHAHAGGGGFALVLLGLDGFRAINDRFGQETGDDLLTLAADRLRAALPEDHTVARLAGDEFAILAPIADRHQAALCAQNLLDRMRQPFPLERGEYHLSASAGLTCCPEDGDSVGLLLRNGDLALAEAKARARGQVRVFQPELSEAASARARLENDLRGALARGEMEVWYQPQIHLDGGRLAGVEALLRWRHPIDGLIAPSHFIPMAEQARLIDALGDWVLREACGLAVALRAEGILLPRVAVNVSPMQLQQPDFVARMAAALAAADCSAPHLELEVTESTLLADPATSIANLVRLRELGIRIAIDDFGTGYSSLAMLRQLPLDCLKIDRAFVSGTPGDANASAIIRAIMAMAHALRLEVLAEGVETEEQAGFLDGAGCDTVQGDLYARAMPVEELIPWLKARMG
ncbi:MAG: EAL domain-containing protein [Betaproteobacteria bacterium]|nr:EAL domain-containing protein [Betaproteobacteria bacterium]